LPAVFKQSKVTGRGTTSARRSFPSLTSFHLAPLQDSPRDRPDLSRSLANTLLSSLALPRSSPFSSLLLIHPSTFRRRGLIKQWEDLQYHCEQSVVLPQSPSTRLICFPSRNPPSLPHFDSCPTQPLPCSPPSPSLLPPTRQGPFTDLEAISSAISRRLLFPRGFSSLFLQFNIASSSSPASLNPLPLKSTPSAFSSHLSLVPSAEFHSTSLASHAFPPFPTSLVSPLPPFLERRPLSNPTLQLINTFASVEVLLPRSSRLYPCP
jgi:hypothetical protein